VLPGGKDGRQLAEEALRLRPALKVLYTTGYMRNAMMHNDPLDAGVDLINKPFTAQTLGERVRAALDR
jgi:FixJ family two-component response regulator